MDEGRANDTARVPETRGGRRGAETIAAQEARWKADADWHRFRNNIYDMAEVMAPFAPDLDVGSMCQEECIVHLLWRLWPPEAWVAGDQFLEEMAWEQDRVEEWETFRARRDAAAAKAGRGAREDGKRSGVFG